MINLRVVAWRTTVPRHRADSWRLSWRGYLRNHILPRWQTTPLREITALAVNAWRKQLRTHLAASTVACIFTVFSMLLDDAVDERVWALPDHILRIADQAGTPGGPSAKLLVITAAWTGCRWGELAGLQRDHLLLDRQRNHGVLVIDPDMGALHGSGHQLKRAAIAVTAITALSSTIGLAYSMTASALDNAAT